MHRPLKFSVWFSVVIVAVFVVAWLWIRESSVPGPYDLEPISIVRNGNKIDTSTNDTAGWQTYRNEEYGFRFRYPTEWNVFEKVLSKGQGELPGESTGFTYKKVELSKSAIDIIFSPLDLADENNFPFQDQSIAIDLVNNLAGGSKNIDDFWSKLATSRLAEFLKKETLSGVDFIVFLEHTKTPSKAAIFMYNDNFFEISYGPPINYGTGQYQFGPQILETFLSTFKTMR